MEAAFAVASLVSVLVLGVGAVVSVTAQVRCVDAARESARLTARLTARGDTDGAARAISVVGPPNASTSTRREGEMVRVQVRAPVAFLPGLTVSATAVALLEPGAE